jgi:hypothetical protein
VRRGEQWRGLHDGRGMASRGRERHRSAGVVQQCMARSVGVRCVGEGKAGAGWRGTSWYVAEGKAGQARHGMSRIGKARQAEFGRARSGPGWCDMAGMDRSAQAGIGTARHGRHGLVWLGRER